MRGLALATLFLGLCLIDAGRDGDTRATLAGMRIVVFIVALGVIWFGE